MATTTELYACIGEKNSGKVLAPPGGKSSIGFGNESVEKTEPKNAASAQKARDLSSNPVGPGPADSVPPHWAAQDNQQEGGPREAPRPRGAPQGRAKVPAGGHSAVLW